MAILGEYHIKVVIRGCNMNKRSYRVGWAAVVVLVLQTICRAGTPTTAPATTQPIRVACVGDSVTEGFTIDHPEKNGYPADLNRILGKDYVVRNFGAGGTTCLLKGDRPFVSDFRHFYEKSAEFKPSIVVLMLGANDSKAMNFSHKDEFAHDLGQLVDHFLAIDSKPRVYLCLPVPAYSGAYGISNDNINQLIPIIREVAKQKEVPLIDANAALQGHPEDFSDGIHPNAQGAKRLAETVAKELTRHPIGGDEPRR
jgi:alpha-L-fucosidase 2